MSKYTAGRVLYQIGRMKVANRDDLEIEAMLRAYAATLSQQDEWPPAKPDAGAVSDDVIGYRWESLYQHANEGSARWHECFDAEAPEQSSTVRNITPLCASRHARQVPDEMENVHADLPPGYRMASRDGDYWPLFNDSYATNNAFPTRELASLAAWKQAHEKLDTNMAGIRRLAAPHAPEKD